MEADGAARAIEALVHDYSKLVFHVIYGLTGHWEESEDLTQDTFIQAFRGIEAAHAASGPQFQAKAWHTCSRGGYVLLHFAIAENHPPKEISPLANWPL